MSIYSPRQQRNAKLAALLLGLAALVLLALCLFVWRGGVDLPAASNAVGNAARTEMVHEAVGRLGDK